MDSCFLYICLVIFLTLVICAAVGYYSDVNPKKEYNRVRREYVNSVVPTNGKAEDNMELMSQMRPSDEVIKYVDLKCTVKGKPINGYIAVTKERLIFKSVAVGDNTSNINSGLANNLKSTINFRFDVKEETANIPISKVTSMSMSTQSVDLVSEGCSFTGQPSFDQTIEAYVLSINAQGIIYKLFLGQCSDIAKEFSRTFTSMTYDKEE